VTLPLFGGSPEAAQLPLPIGRMQAPAICNGWMALEALGKALAYLGEEVLGRDPVDPVHGHISHISAQQALCWLVALYGGPSPIEG